VISPFASAALGANHSGCSSRSSRRTRAAPPGARRSAWCAAAGRRQLLVDGCGSGANGSRASVGIGKRGPVIPGDIHRPHVRPGSPHTIHCASDRPTPPPWLEPAMTRRPPRNSSGPGSDLQDCHQGEGEGPLPRFPYLGGGNCSRPIQAHVPPNSTKQTLDTESRGVLPCTASDCPAHPARFTPAF
jgi:hypothetical protein